MMKVNRQRILAAGAAIGLLLAACSPAATATLAPVTVTPAPTTAAATDPGSTPASATGGRQYRLTAAAQGNEARFRVREQLANVAFPSDAVGKTSAIQGGVAFAVEGGAVKVVTEDSGFVVELGGLKSDSGMRDNFIKGNTLETNRYPTAEFKPTEVVGLPAPLPTDGDVAFQLIGDLTVHGVTRQVTWAVTAKIVNQQSLVGTAITSFTFGDFGMEIPRVARVLSIQDHIQLEYDFNLVLQQ